MCVALLFVGSLRVCCVCSLYTLRIVHNKSLLSTVILMACIFSLSLLIGWRRHHGSQGIVPVSHLVFDILLFDSYILLCYAIVYRRRILLHIFIFTFFLSFSSFFNVWLSPFFAVSYLFFSHSFFLSFTVAIHRLRWMETAGHCTPVQGKGMMVSLGAPYNTVGAKNVLLFIHSYARPHRRVCSFLGYY